MQYTDYLTSYYLNSLISQPINNFLPPLFPPINPAPINPFLQDFSMQNFLNQMQQQNNLQNHFQINNNYYNAFNTHYNPPPLTNQTILQYLTIQNNINSISTINGPQLSTDVNHFHTSDTQPTENLLEANDKPNATKKSSRPHKNPSNKEDIIREFTKPIYNNSRLLPNLRDLEKVLVKRKRTNRNLTNTNNASNKTQKTTEVSKLNESRSSNNNSNSIHNEQSTIHPTFVQGSYKKMEDETSIYEGYVDNNAKPHGLGKLFLKQKNEHYDGEFCHGLRHGMGKIKNAEYELKGRFKDNLPSGLVEYEDAISTIIGQMERGHFIGQCFQKIKETKEEYNGSFFKFEKQGKGRWDQIDFYFDGFFCHDKMLIGKLVNKKTQQVVFEGPHTPDTMKYIKQENSYVCLHDKNTRNTSIISESGSYYFGQANDHIKHGEGIFYFTNGCIYTGSFENGKMQGLGKMLTQDGYYDGQFNDDKRDGFGVFHPDDGSPPTMGRWSKGQLTSAVNPNAGKQAEPFSTRR